MGGKFGREVGIRNLKYKKGEHHQLMMLLDPNLFVCGLYLGEILLAGGLV
jgi:hypothetical protein